MKNIVIIGFMATGKSTVGRYLAQRLKRPFIDTDKEIEAVTGKTVAQIFARDGEKRFRSEENLLVKKLVLKKGLIIATGGGMVLNPENFRLLKENGILIALTAAPDIIYQRVKGKRDRPLLAKGDLRENIKTVLQEREGIYQEADLTVDTGICSANEAVEQIISYLEERKSLG
ncbi:MAG: Shikimate kinase 1 [Firmicutes bacterium ADurb.Bin373]|nr:MAG: Shikimate kinase 1 [Firmicutes bacterium ADurb.Bin373]